MPPIQCVKLLQKRIEYGMISTLVRIDDPVVVKPEEDSKKALMNDGIVPLIIYGRVPISVNVTHDKVTARYPSRLLILSISAFWLISLSIMQNRAQMTEDQIKG